MGSIPSKYKVKVTWPPEGSYSAAYRKRFHKLGLPKLNGRFILDSIPRKIREAYYRQLRKESFHRTIDLKIFTYKYYPWCYRDEYPTLVLQGWYDVDLAKARYIKRYGKNALKHIKFIKGKEAVERGFKIGPSLFICGKWRMPMNKTLKFMTKHSRRMNALNRRIIENSAKKSLQVEKIMKNELKYQEYQEKQRTYIPEITYKKRIKLQEIQETNQKRSRTLYED